MTVLVKTNSNLTDRPTELTASEREASDRSWIEGSGLQLREHNLSNGLAVGQSATSKDVRMEAEGVVEIHYQTTTCEGIANCEVDVNCRGC
jgi:hypothetical protein